VYNIIGSGLMNNEENPTSDLSRFGHRELKIASKLISTYSEDVPDFLGTEVRVYMNTNSGFVFLSDADLSVGMMNGEKLEQWFNCPVCGHEGFKEDMKHEGNKECREYLKSIGV
jgi:hypothetical protein